MLFTHVALLRGVNVGGKNKLPMRDLAAIFSEAGCCDVRTYIQSGNVIFNAAPGRAARIPKLVSEEIAKRFGLTTPVVLRSSAELRDVVAANPFFKEGADEDTLYVLFLADAPTPESVARLDPDRSPPDEFAVRGRQIYLHLPNGVARSKLTNDYFDRTLGTVSTGRNWRTVTKLIEMVGA